MALEATERSITGFPGGSDGKDSVCNVGDPGLIPGLGRSPEQGHGNPLQYSCVENPMDRVAWRGESHGQSSLTGYSPQGHKESDTTERLTLPFFKDPSKGNG